MTPFTAIPLEGFVTDIRTPDPVLEALVDLHTRTLDSLAGFEKVVEKAAPEFRAVADSFRALHHRHAATLATLLTARGHAADTDGSFMGTVNRGVVTMRAWFDDIDSDLLAAIHQGEDHVLTMFDAVLQQPLSAADTTVINTMRDELVELLDANPAA